MSVPKVTRPTFEHHHNSLGLQCVRPRLSWRFISEASTAQAWKQTGYELQVSSKGSSESKAFRVDSDQSTLVPWPSSDLISRTSVNVKVRAFGTSNGAECDPTPWSDEATVEAALLDRHDWTASFISTAERIGKHGPLHPLRFRKTFNLPLEFGNESRRSARLYITALGVFNVYIDGESVSDEFLAPGWTDYNARLGYRVLDVTKYLTGEGPHCLCIEVAEGWYAGRLGFKGGKRFFYGDELAVLAQLEISDANSVPAWSLVTDDTWQCQASAIVNSELYDGEVYDASIDDPSWKNSLQPDNAEKWLPTKTVAWPQCKLFAPEQAPVRVTQQLKPIEVFTSKSGKTIIDFGQNLVGKVLVESLNAPKGKRITFRHAEVMEHGELGTRPLREAKAEDIVIASDQPIRDWTPKFTFHGFRFVEVSGWEPTKDNIKALVTHSNMERRGYFECSNSSVNQLHSNVSWSMRGNFLSIPTDCPQRDERLGWTGDIHAFAPSASFLYDTTSFLGSWLEDLMYEQLLPGKGGIPPLVSPNVLPPNWPHMPQAVWDDVTVMTPWDLYRYSGDLGILERQLPSMKAWLEEAIDRGADGLWNRDRWQLADWLDPSAPPEDPGYARTDNVLVADAYLVQVTSLMSRILSLLGEEAAAAKYDKDATRLRAEFSKKYITPAGNLMSNTQTGLSLAIQFGIYTERNKLSVAATELHRSVRAAKFNISTGFAGTPVVTHALTTTCAPQLAYRMLLEKTCPSWIYPVTMGATTTWERWDSMLPDGTINPGQMTSFNHYALGAVADWLHTTVGGIAPDAAGWKIVRVRPVPGGNITSASVKFDGPYGLIACSWNLSEDGTKFQMALTLPPNSSAKVTLPSQLKRSVEAEGEEAFTLVGSGSHSFKCSWEPAEWPPKAIYAANQTPREPQIAT